MTPTTPTPPTPRTVSESWAAGEIAKRDAHIDALKAELDDLRQSFTMNGPPQDEGDEPPAAGPVEAAAKDTDPQRYDNCRDWWTILERLAGHRSNFRLIHDHRYGLDERTGWSVIIDGVVRSQFCDTPQEAVMKAVLKAAAHSGP